MKYHCNLHFIAALIGWLLFAACSGNENEFVFKGKLTGITQAEFYIYPEDNHFNGIDTISITDGQFEYRCQVDQPTILTLLYPNFTYTYVVAEPGKSIKMEGDAAKLGEADIWGTKDNELLTKFRQETHDKNPEEQRMAAAHFIENNVQTTAATAIFKKYFLQAKDFQAETALPLLKTLKKAQPENIDVKFIENHYLPLLESDAGGTLPDFHAVTLDSTEISREDFKGKPTIIAFFSTWQNSNYQIVPNLRKYEKTYGDSLKILAISLDYDLKRCKVRIEQDSLASPVVCDTKAFNSPLALQFGIRYVPSCILADKTGKIISRDLPLKDLEKEVNNLMSK